MEGAGQVELVITDFEGHTRESVPSLCEIWNWEGDKTVLPTKWSETLMRTFGIDISPSELKKTFVESPLFDPEAFFFVTHRSNSIGCCLVWPEDDKADPENTKYFIRFLCAEDRYRSKKLEKALAGLAIEYMNKNKPEVGKLYVVTHDQEQCDILKEMGFMETD